MDRLRLPTVTLCAVDTRAPALALASLQRSQRAADFARTVLFSHEPGPALAAQAAAAGIELVDIGVLRSGADYSRFVLVELASHIDSAHVLITQWDGFVTDPAAWHQDFLACDYVGAVWPDAPRSQCVGNGGFSLRSRRLLQASASAQWPQWHPEDQVLGRQRRSELEGQGLCFAAAALARRFAFENETPQAPTFGFHGPYNLPRFLDEAVLSAWLTQLPDDFFRSRDARRLARAALSAGQPRLAQAVVARRLRAGRREPATRLLGLAAQVYGLFLPRQFPR